MVPKTMTAKDVRTKTLLRADLFAELDPIRLLQLFPVRDGHLDFGIHSCRSESSLAFQCGMY